MFLLLFVDRKAMEIIMSDCCNSPNKSIRCSVSQCQYHCNTKDYCSLESIQVGTHEANPTMIECTDCTSFKLRS